jgi:hypothetical protein
MNIAFSLAQVATDVPVEVPTEVVSSAPTWAAITLAILAILGGLPIVLKALAAVIPGDKDDAVIGKIISGIEWLRNVLNPKPKA